MRKVTMKDVAREAGVSVATVSYVLNDTKKYKISEETKKVTEPQHKKLNNTEISAKISPKKQTYNRFLYDVFSSVQVNP